MNLINPLTTKPSLKSIFRLPSTTKEVVFKSKLKPKSKLKALSTKTKLIFLSRL